MEQIPAWVVSIIEVLAVVTVILLLVGVAVALFALTTRRPRGKKEGIKEEKEERYSDGYVRAVYSFVERHPVLVWSIIVLSVLVGVLILLWILGALSLAGDSSTSTTPDSLGEKWVRTLRAIIYTPPVWFILLIAVVLSAYLWKAPWWWARAALLPFVALFWLWVFQLADFSTPGFLHQFGFGPNGPSETWVDFRGLVYALLFLLFIAYVAPGLGVPLLIVGVLAIMIAILSGETLPNGYKLMNAREAAKVVVTIDGDQNQCALGPLGPQTQPVTTHPLFVRKKEWNCQLRGIVMEGCVAFLDSEERYEDAYLGWACEGTLTPEFRGKAVRRVVAILDPPSGRDLPIPGGEAEIKLNWCLNGAPGRSVDTCQ